MESPEVAITKATLSATLFRADPTSLTRPAVDAFFPLLSKTLAQCSRPNVQKCKAWIVDKVALSNARAAALGKFLVALSKSLAAEDDGKRPSVKRRRLHMLYVLNDVLFHEVIRRENRKFGEVWNGVLPALVGSAAAFDNCPKHKKKLEDLIGLWEGKGYFSSELVAQLRGAIINGITENPAIDLQPSTTSLKLAKDTPYILPSFHGDSSCPWYDLPAATWLPHIIPNSSKPMAPSRIRPLQLAPGPADKRLTDAVKSLLEDVERMFSKERKVENDPHTDLGELGERIVLDEMTGDVMDGETYYGWSRQFCERMKDRKKKALSRGSTRGRSSSRSRSRSRSRGDSRGRSRSNSPPSFKRPRLSSRSRSRHRSRSRSASRSHRKHESYSRSRSRSRSHSRSRSASRNRRRNESYSRSRSRSRSRSADRRYRRGNSNSGSYHHRRSDSRSRSPLPPPSTRPTNMNRPPPQSSHAPPMSFPPTAPPIPGNFSTPPPPPPPPPPPVGYPGHWPPPPPPVMPPSMAGPSPQGGWMSSPGFMMPQMMGGWASNLPPPPPPPPPPHPPQNTHYGRGNGSYRGRGRGGYDRGGYRGR